MLGAVLADFKAWGRLRVVTTRDRRFDGVWLPADRVVELAADDHCAALPDLAAECAAVLLIAPESEGILARLTARLETKPCCRQIKSHPTGKTVTC